VVDSLDTSPYVWEDNTRVVGPDAIVHNEAERLKGHSRVQRGRETQKGAVVYNKAERLKRAERECDSTSEVVSKASLAVVGAGSGVIA